MKSEKVIIEVAGGVVTAVHGVKDYEILDWDNLLPDSWTTGETAAQWDSFSPKLQQIIRTGYGDDYIRIQERIKRDAELFASRCLQMTE